MYAVTSLDRGPKPARTKVLGYSFLAAQTRRMYVVALGSLRVSGEPSAFGSPESKSRMGGRLHQTGRNVGLCSANVSRGASRRPQGGCETSGDPQVRPGPSAQTSRSLGSNIKTILADAGPTGV